MRKNRKPILSKIQNVMGIKNGKYCSSDVSITSINGNNGGGAVPAFKESVQQQSVTYTNCPNRETVNIDFKDVENNGGIIPDCVLGGSVTLNNLNGYVVNYGQTICPVTVKEIQSCDFGVRNMIVDFGDNVVVDGSVLQLSFNGPTRPGCYTIIGDSVPPSEDSVASLEQVQDCSQCRRVQTYPQIQSCKGGLTYSVISNVALNKSGSYYYTFENGSVPNGCYTSIGTTQDSPVDTIISSSDSYIDCETCENNN